MNKYIYVEVNADKTEIIGKGPRPEWVFNGSPVEDDVLAAGGYTTNNLGELVLDNNGEPILAEGRNGWLPLYTPEQPSHDDILDSIRLQREDEWVIDGNRVVCDWVVEPLNLLVAKGTVISLIDEYADIARRVFLTDGGPGQSLEYDQTRREAEEWIEAVDPDIDDFPMLRAEYNARRVAEPSITAQQVVDDTMSEITVWKLVGSAIKEIRRTAKVALEIAENRERIRHIYDWADAAFQSATRTGEFEPLPSAA